MMNDPSRRKKQPERVRRMLLDTAARLAVDEGLAAMTVQAVASAAGVTKGGLFHHFPNKAALVAAVFSDLLDRLDAQIDALMAADQDAHGRFTRAYVEAVFDDHALDNDGPWAALSVSMITDPELRRLWSGWMEHRLAQHAGTDNDPALEVVRLAADGAWLAFLLGSSGAGIDDIAALRTRLVGMTRG